MRMCTNYRSTASNGDISFTRFRPLTFRPKVETQGLVMLVAIFLFNSSFFHIICDYTVKGAIDETIKVLTSTDSMLN